MARSLPLWAIALGLTLLGGVVASFAPLGPATFGGPFSLSDVHGQTVTDATLHGEPFVVFFGFTRCPSVCPLTLARLTRIRRELGPAAPKVVFVTVDPHDTPADVERYLEAFGLPILGLVGTRDERARMMTAYRVFASGDASHTATVFLLGARGEPLGTLEPWESDAAWRTKLQSQRSNALLHSFAER